MNKMARRAGLWGLALGAAIGVAGCATRPGAVPAGGAVMPVLRNAARAVLVGRAYDRAFRALRNEDEAAQLAAGEELRQLDDRDMTARLARVAVFQAVILDGQAERLSGAPRDRVRERSTALYQQALHLMPEFDSPEPQEINALGYFLAERGTSAADYKQAERLTRRALKLIDQKLAAPNLSAAQRDLLRFERAYTAQDSLAWALFRQGCYAEALREQENAVQEATATASTVGAKVPAVLPDHLAAIEAALKNTGEHK